MNHARSLRVKVKIRLAVARTRLFRTDSRIAGQKEPAKSVYQNLHAPTPKRMTIFQRHDLLCIVSPLRYKLIDKKEDDESENSNE